MTFSRHLLTLFVNTFTLYTLTACGTDWDPSPSEQLEPSEDTPHPIDATPDPSKPRPSSTPTHSRPSPNPVDSTPCETSSVAPELASFAPLSARPGVSIDIDGRGFGSRSQCPPKVLFPSMDGGSVEAELLSRSPTELRVVIPDAAATGFIEVHSKDWPVAASVEELLIERPARVHVENSSQLHIIDVRANGYDLLGFPNGIGARDIGELDIPAGEVELTVGFGWYSDSGADIIAVTASWTAVLRQGRRETLSVDSFTIGQVLTNWSDSPTRFATNSIPGSDGRFHTYEVVFQPSGDWTLREAGQSQVLDSGQVQLVEWAPGGDSLSFSFKARSTPIEIRYPFSQFDFQDGAGTLEFSRR
ncbi:MAG: hypothetical protein HY791_09510 [Deltaproteobacteria bacterium]|nr:hypothetical protein [Deltaproteobacteria bacterium]